MAENKRIIRWNSLSANSGGLYLILYVAISCPDGHLRNKQQKYLSSLIRRYLSVNKKCHTFVVQLLDHLVIGVLVRDKESADDGTVIGICSSGKYFAITFIVVLVDGIIHAYKNLWSDDTFS